MKKALLNRKVKYIHLLWANETKFNGPLVDTISRAENHLDAEEHVFITPHKDVFEKTRSYKNVILDQINSNLFNVYGEWCDWLISHDYPSNRIALFVKKKYKKKIVFRYWGGRREAYQIQENKFFRNIAGRVYNGLYNRMFRYKYSRIAAVGIANLVDEIDLKPLLGDTPMFIMTYPKRNVDHDLIQAKNKIRIKDGYLNVMIGHKSEPLENHIYYLKLLKRFDGEKMRIYIPLSYGNKEYGEKIKKFVKEEKMQNVVIVDEFMEYGKYLELIHTMDIALMECTNSIALGNVAALLTFGKTIYLSREGVIKKAFDYENIPHRCLDEIEKMEFEEFKTLLTIEENNNYSLKIRSYEKGVGYWKVLLNYLNSKCN
ncbi:MAG: TDP-N-acetylfucosamine:lipid II N-acetylfucosaminyltransferase [Ruminococcus sp.]|nr:TDP-N-acetylfucosamine:lipid II N-acetylfucosaminyltransferase [Ruminococcus sp.]